MINNKFRCLFITSILFISACSTRQSVIHHHDSIYLHEPGRVKECIVLFVTLEKVTADSGQQDVQYYRLKDFPYLRTNRFLSSFRFEVADKQEKRDQWLQYLRSLDQESRIIEIHNLKLEDIYKTGIKQRDELVYEIENCGEILLNRDRENPGQIKKIIDSSYTPVSYSVLARIIGIYAFSKLFIEKGIKKLHREIKNDFNNTGNFKTISNYYVPASGMQQSSAIDIKQILNSSDVNPLSIPRFTKDELKKLFNHYAPIWNIEEKSFNDKPGAPIWNSNDKIHIDTSNVKVYKYLSYTRIKNYVFPQFNYTIWFPSRPVNGAFDLLGGHLDGITWRVTVDLKGRPVIYDAIHNCGCYHMWFPTGYLSPKVVYENTEPILVPQITASLVNNQKIILHIASDSHFIRGLSITDQVPRGLGYEFAEYNELRSLKFNGDKNKSMFGKKGIVYGTSRKERWLIWPMGVIDAGAMRQWGHHATAFIGRRHFDDPYLLDDYFKINRL